MRPNDDEIVRVCLECMAHYRLAPADAVWLTECPVCGVELHGLEEEDNVRPVRALSAA